MNRSRVSSIDFDTFVVFCAVYTNSNKVTDSKPMTTNNILTSKTVFMAEGTQKECESLIPRSVSEHNGTTDHLAIDHLTIDGLTSSAIDLLTPTSKGVYTQYIKDYDDNLLVDGYFRENMPKRVLPPEVNRIIAAYYLKTYSVQNLQNKLKPLPALRMKLYFGSIAIPMEKLHKFRLHQIEIYMTDTMFVCVSSTSPKEKGIGEERGRDIGTESEKEREM